MKKIIAGLAMATIASGVLSISTPAWAGNDHPACAVLLALPGGYPVTVPPQATGGSRCDP